MKADNHIKSLLKGLEILELVGEHMPITVTEISDRTGLSKSSVSKILSTFQSRGYVQQERTNKNFSIGPSTIRLGIQAYEKLDISVVAKDEMEKLTEKYDENTMIMIEQQLKAVVISVCKAKSPNRLSVHLGYQYMLYRGAAPKVLLAFQTEDVREEVIARADWLPITKQTITTEAELRKRLERIRRDRFETSLGEFDMGTMAYAVPIFNAYGKVVSAMAIAGEKKRMQKHDASQVINDLIKSAVSISYKLGSPQERIDYLKEVL